MDKPLSEERTKHANCMIICFLADGLFHSCPAHGRCITEGIVVRVKARAVENKRWQRLDPAGGRWGIFGLHTVPDRATEVVLTEVRNGSAKFETSK